MNHTVTSNCQYKQNEKKHSSEDFMTNKKSLQVFGVSCESIPVLHDLKWLLIHTSSLYNL